MRLEHRMRAPLFLNYAIRSVQWHDLRELTFFQTVRALLLSAPWLALSLGFASAELFWAAIPFSMVFFMAALRQTHDGFHGKLGLSPRWTHAFLFLFSMLMVIPLHAVRWIHLRHHAHPLDEKDVEGMCAGMSWWKALLAGPVFSFRMIHVAFVNANRVTRMWIAVELTVIAGMVVLAVFMAWPLVCYQLVVMTLGNCLTGFVAVWMVHRACDPGGMFARTQRSWLINLLTLNNFFHLEHHLFPAVASCNLPELARRLDQVLPTALPVVGTESACVVTSNAAVSPAAQCRNRES
jgi:fatty acid desaturase